MAECAGLAHVGLFSRDLERSREFYCGKLGFEKIWECTVDEPDGTLTQVMFLKNGGLVLEVMLPETPPARPDGRFDHVALAVSDIEAWQQRLEAEGIAFESEAPVFKAQVFPNGSKWLMFRGPDGERLELNEVLD